MATWQYDFFLVPKGAIENKFGEIPFHIDYTRYEDEDWWQTFANTDDITKRISSFLSESKSWSSNMRTWGIEESNRIDLFYESKNISEFFVRADTRDISLNFLISIVSLAADFGLILWTTEGHLIDPSLQSLRFIIEESEASSFSKDPAQFLNRLKSQSKGGDIVQFKKE